MAGIYVHIPFCKRKCIYCDFFSVAFSDAAASRYADDLVSEFAVRKSELRGEKVHTLYIGGGTPSLMPIESLQKIVGNLVADVGGLEEFTIEVNPDDITPGYADSLIALGCNRISMGVQSFNDGELQLLNRRHDAAEAEEAVKLLRSAGFGNISIDLIYGIPGQSMQSWEDSVRKAIELGVEHISAYNLTYEEGTRLFHMREKGRIEEASDNLCVEMFSMLRKMLSDAGYEQYEISNFALPGWYSRHNSAYWDFTPYIGLGASAHSFDGICRRYNPSNLRKYMELVEKSGLAYTVEEEDKNELFNEWVMVRLRTCSGMDLAQMLDRFGKEYVDTSMPILEKYANDGCLVLENGIVRLTEKGIMLSDMIFRDLFVV